MKKILAVLACAVSLYAQAEEGTIVIMRHGEKPAAGLGQLDCKGLNRALSLPSVLSGKFGKPDALYASNPSVMKNDKGVDYPYIRPLATIEPTAVSFSMPVNIAYGMKEIDTLADALTKEHGTVFVAWEHHLARELSVILAGKFGIDAASIPSRWNDDDFDSLFVFENKDGKTTFRVDREGLDGMPDTCGR